MGTNQLDDEQSWLWRVESRISLDIQLAKKNKLG